jgi:hypothetical protein
MPHVRANRGRQGSRRRWGFVNENPSIKAGARWDYDLASYLNDSLTFAR